MTILVCHRITSVMEVMFFIFMLLNHCLKNHVVYFHKIPRVFKDISIIQTFIVSYLQGMFSKVELYVYFDEKLSQGAFYFAQSEFLRYYSR